ncbi:MAG: hypothetical protein Fur0024_3210 [Patescibacteria group bacterium]
MIQKLFNYIRKKIVLSPNDLLEEGEEIILIVRRHLLHFAGIIAKLVLFYFFIPMIFFYFAFFIFSINEIKHFFENPISIFLTFFWAVFGLGYGIYFYLLWFQDSFIFTNLRIFDVDQYSIFNRSISSIGWESVSDITFTSKNFFEVAFDIGLVQIITNAERTNIEIHPVAHPQNLASEIIQMAEKFTGERSTAITDEELEKKAKVEAILQHKLETHLEKLREKKKIEEEKKIPDYLKEKL